MVHMNATISSYDHKLYDNTHILPFIVCYWVKINFKDWNMTFNARDKFNGFDKNGIIIKHIGLCQLDVDFK